LAAYALELGECDGGCREFDGRRDRGEGYGAAFFADVVFLPVCDLGEDVGGCFVEFVEVVLFCRWFLGGVRMGYYVCETKHTKTVAWFGLTTLSFPSLPINASQIWSKGGVSSSSRTVKSGLSHLVMPLGSSYRNIRFSKSSSS